MHIENLVYGLLDTSRHIENRALADKLRSLTISWSRYGYHDVILENSSINKILDAALELGYKYCLVQAYGHLIAEDWHPKHLRHADFQTVQRDWMADHDFFVTGYIVDRENGWYGLKDDCLLVNLDYYAAFGRPAYGLPCSGPVEVSKPVCGASLESAGAAAPRWLRPSLETEKSVPALPGWNFIQASLKNGKTVYHFDEQTVSRKLFINPGAGAQSNSFARSLEQSQTHFPAASSDVDANEDGRKFLRLIESQLNNAPRGVFLWNVESYDDVRVPPSQFKAPLKTLYCVAAGFKPNMILHTHGFDEQTSVVFFDYSPNALGIRRLLQQEWDGQDYPRFIRYVLGKFPAPDTFYQLWAGASTENLNWHDVQSYWEDEIERWGGERVLREHWAAYRELKHEYVQCNVLTEPHKLLRRIEPQPDSVIWWSNAFFTVYSNYLFSIDEKRRFYENWISGLAKANPSLFIYGSDYNNISVNCIQAQTYWEQYSAAGRDYLRPLKFCQTEIRF
ncbi:MAG TPA: hypothetical protein VGO91_02815 [Pyrinomonadaceae bacterium]|jgi:hypothetical protein|nr:hypothetical protein [Pyrinomonadaceae bacterium]